ncbi:MAG: HipA N-terminal domain-containing protein, partial [Paramuribaculum sp.]|nr:HipA N-terminal domain-containing protein [Paramuribaculum sp.]
MVDIAKVNLYGKQMGAVRWDSSRNTALFEYAEDFIGKGLEPSPILMPVRHNRVYSFRDIGRETFKGLPGMLADSLPDTYGRALFERWLALTGHQSGNAVETLCFLGKRCMGALEFEPAMDVPYGNDIKIEIDSLVEVAREALAEKEEFGVNLTADKKAAIAEIVRLGTSAGGQRAKAIIAYNKETGEVRSGQVD